MEEELVYCQGMAELRAEEADRGTESQSLDLPAVQARCPHHISGSECYQRYRELSLNYGPAYQGIEHLSIGDGEVLARFRLPSVVAQTQTEGGCRDGAGPCPLPYVLHPSVLDAALHASIGLLIAQKTHMQLQVPFALSGISIDGPVPTQGWAWIRRSPQSLQTGAEDSDPVPMSVFDIDVCDDAGRIAVRLRDLSTRPLSGTFEPLRTRLLTPDWKEEAVAGPPLHLSEEAPIFSQQVVLLCDIPTIEASRIQAQMAPGVLCHDLHSSHLRRELRFQDIVLQLIQELQHLLAGVGKGLAPLLVQVVMAHREEPSLLEALVGVLKSVEQEYPQLQGQLIEIEEEQKKMNCWPICARTSSACHRSHTSAIGMASAG